MLVLSSCFQICCSKSVLADNFELNIIHMNDIHAHFDEISLNAGMHSGLFSYLCFSVVRSVPPGRAGQGRVFWRNGKNVYSNPGIYEDQPQQHSSTQCWGLLSGKHWHYTTLQGKNTVFFLEKLWAQESFTNLEWWRLWVVVFAGCSESCLTFARRSSKHLCFLGDDVVL